MSILSIRKTAPPPRSPEREALAAAIERHANAVRGLDATRRALSEARGDNELETVERAKAGVAEAKLNAAKHMTDAALGNAGEAPVSIKEARRILQDAEDELETSRAVQSTLQARLTVCEGEMEWATRRLTESVRDVVRSEPGIQNLLAKFEAARKDLDRRRRDLQWLDSQFMIPDEFKNWDLEEVPHQADPSDLTAGTAPWASVFAELASNSDAPLPVT